MTLLVLTFHGGDPRIAAAFPAGTVIRNFAAAPFTGGYAREGSGVVPVLVDELARQHCDRAVLFGFSEGCQAVRALVRNPRNAALIAGLATLDGVHGDMGAAEPTASAALVDAYVQPWCAWAVNANAGFVPWFWTASSIETRPSYEPTRRMMGAILRRCLGLSVPAAGAWSYDGAALHCEIATGANAAAHVAEGAKLGRAAQYIAAHMTGVPAPPLPSGAGGGATSGSPSSSSSSCSRTSAYVMVGLAFVGLAGAVWAFADGRRRAAFERSAALGLGLAA